MKILRTIGIFTVSYFIAHVGLIMAGNTIPDWFSESIKSQKQLEKVVEEEAPKLGLSAENIWIKYYPSRFKAKMADLSNPVSGIYGFNKETKEIHPYDEINGTTIVEIPALEIPPGSEATRNSVRHELYHIKFHNHKPYSGIEYFSIDEPNAILYALTGLVSD